MTKDETLQIPQLAHLSNINTNVNVNVNTKKYKYKYKDDSQGVEGAPIYWSWAPIYWSPKKLFLIFWKGTRSSKMNKAP